jgi:anti-anti-sigma factor
MACAHDPGLRLRVGAHRLGARTVVIPIGEIDIATNGMFRDCLDHCTGCVVVDLAGVTFLDSSGIGTIAVTRNRLENDSGSLELREPQPIVRAAIEAVGLGHWITS